MNAVDLLTEIVSTESLSGHEGAVAELLVARMNELGFDAHVDGAGNAVGTRRGPRGSEVPGQPERRIVLLGHMDTVPGRIPVRREGDLLYGRGSVDAKGPLATFVMAVAGIDPAPGCVLTVIGAVEEESATSKGARHVAAEHPAPELCLIGEPSGWDALTLGYKGRVLIDYTLVLPCGHSAGPLAGAPEHAAAFWQTVQRLCDEANAGHDKLFDQVLPSLRSMRTDSDGLHDTARLTIGLRLPPGFDRDAWSARLTEAAGNAELDLYGYEPAWSTGRSSPLARAFLRAIRSQQGKPTFKVKTGTADLNVLGPVWRCPIVAYGPGDSTLDHTPDEHISVAEYERAIAVLSTALVEAGFAK